MPNRNHRKNRKSVKKFSHDRKTNSLVKKALLVLEKKPSMSHREVARTVCSESPQYFEAVRRGVSRHVERQSKPAKRHGAHALTLEQELMVVGVIIAFSIYMSPLNNSQILLCVNETFNKSLAHPWVADFLVRHKKHLTTRKVKQIQTARVLSNDLNTIGDWIERHERWMESRHFPIHARFNIDETRLVPPSDKRRVVAKKQHKFDNRESRITSLGTLVPVINSKGECFMSFYVLKDHEELNMSLPGKLKVHRGRDTWPRRFAMTSTGYTNKELWVDIMNSFADRWIELHPGLHCVVYLDNCSVHREDRDFNLDSNFILRLASRGIHCYFFPPNCTHWLQPLDDVIFGQLKTRLKQVHSKISFSAAVRMNADIKLDLTDVIDVEEEVFTSEIITKSWYNTGMASPTVGLTIDKAKIISNAKREFHHSEDEDDRVIELAKKATTAVINNSPTKEPKKVTRIPVTVNRSYSPEELNEMIEVELEIEKEKKAAKEEKAKKKEEETKQKRADRLKKKQELTDLRNQKDQEKRQRIIQKAKAEEQEYRRKHCGYCQRLWRNGKDWLECEICEIFTVCGKCVGGKKMMEEHEETCSGE